MMGFRGTTVGDDAGPPNDNIIDLTVTPEKDGDAERAGEQGGKERWE